MNKDSFDKALKNKIPNTATDFDMEAAWSALEARRKQPKRRFMLWWFVFAGLLLSGSTAGWWFLYPRTSPALKTATIQNQTDQTSLSAQTMPQKAIPAQQLPVGNTLSGKTNPTNKPEAAALRANKTGAVRPHVSSIAQNNFSNTASKTPVQTAATSGSAHKTAQQLPFDLAVAQIQEHSPTSKTDISQKQTTDTAPIKAENTASLTNHISDANPEIAPSQTAPATGTAIALLQPLPQVEILLQTPSRMFQPSNIEFAEAEKRKRSKSANWSIGLHAVYGSNSVNRKGLINFVEARQQEEEPLDMFQAGLDVRRKLSGPWFVQAGIQYVQWTDVRRINQEITSSRPDSNLLLHQIIYPDGNIEKIYGVGELLVVRTVEELRYNRYRHIEVPVMLGAALPVGQRWRLDLSAGLAFGLYSRQSGTATIGTETKQLNTLQYRNAGAIAGQAQFAWMYNSPNWAAGLMLTGRTGLNSNTQTNAPFTEKRHSFGLGIVLRRTLR